MHESAHAPQTARTLAFWTRRGFHRLAAAAVLYAAAAGCSRQHFRERADKDVTGTLTQKNVFPDWQVQNWHVYPDPRARFADPFNPDFPPYPPDDYAAWLLSPNPQKPGKSGVGQFEGKEYLKSIEGWDAQNRAEDEASQAAGSGDRQAPEAGKASDPTQPATASPQRPDAPAYAAVGGPALAFMAILTSEQKPYRLKLEQAVELALFNSREFQDRREDLYLAALPVTLERYTFAAQAFASGQVIRETAGRQSAAGLTNRWRIDSDLGFTRLFPTGGELIVRLANQIVLDLTSSRPDVSVSNLGLSFVQPLLRGGGFAVTLEALTQAERTLVYAIRSYARFRKVFYTALTAAGDYTNNPYTLQGLAVNLGRAIGANFTAPSAGYLQTMLRSATLVNDRKNIATLEQFLRLFQNLKEGGGVTQLQVIQVEQQLLDSRSNLLNNTRLYLDSLDNFKLQLGVPTNMPLELDDTPLRPVRRQVQRFEEVYAQLRDVEARAGAFDAAEPAAGVRERFRRLLTESSLARGTAFAKDYSNRIAELNALTPDALARRAADLAEERRRLLDRRAEREKARQDEPEAETRAIDANEAALDLVGFETALRRYEAQEWQRLPADRRLAARAEEYRRLADAAILVAIQARDQRLDAIRAEWPAVPPIVLDGLDVLAAPLDEAYTKVAQTALVNRLDLMNARGQLVDSWRQIAIQANSLQGQLDVRYDLDVNSRLGDNEPLSFAGPRSRNALTLRFDPPFVRRAERNSYRASLISFQRQRRTLMAFEDNIVNDVRADVRQLRVLAQTLRYQQRSVELAYAQVDNARATLTAPPDPGSARGTAGDAASLTQQLLQAQQRLVSAQNQLYTTWTNYLVFRTTLYLDLELLPLDPQGVWTDECLSQYAPARPDGPAGPDPGDRPADRLPPPQPVPAGER